MSASTVPLLIISSYPLLVWAKHGQAWLSTATYCEVIDLGLKIPGIHTLNRWCLDSSAIGVRKFPIMDTYEGLGPKYSRNSRSRDYVRLFWIFPVSQDPRTDANDLKHSAKRFIQRHTLFTVVDIALLGLP